MQSSDVSTELADQWQAQISEEVQSVDSLNDPNGGCAEFSGRVSFVAVVQSANFGHCGHSS
jgi:hypothetical protein